MSENEDRRNDIQEFAYAWARAQDLSTAAEKRLVSRLHQLGDWMRTLRRTLGIVRQYGPSHPSAARSSQECFDSTSQFLRTHGPVSVTLGPLEMTSEEGFPLIAASEVDTHPLYALFRDGIVRLSLRLGLERSEFDALMSVLAAGGRRDGDDAVTWLWTGRHRHLRLEIEPSVSPKLARTLLSRAPDDPSLSHYLSTLLTLTPDEEMCVERKDAPSLRGQGIDPVKVERLLSKGLAANELEPNINQIGFLLASAELRVARNNKIKHIRNIASATGHGAPHE